MSRHRGLEGHIYQNYERAETKDSYSQNMTKMDVISMPERSSKEVKEPEDIAETLISSYDE